MSSSLWKTDWLKIEALERISEINNLLEINMSVKSEIADRDALAKFNFDAEHPTKAFCNSLNKQKRKTWIRHLRRKWQKTLTEKHKYLGEDMSSHKTRL